MERTAIVRGEEPENSPLLRDLIDRTDAKRSGSDGWWQGRCPSVDCDGRPSFNFRLSSDGRCHGQCKRCETNATELLRLLDIQQPEVRTPTSETGGFARKPIPDRLMELYDSLSPARRRDDHPYLEDKWCPKAYLNTFRVHEGLVWAMYTDWFGRPMSLLSIDSNGSKKSHGSPKGAALLLNHDAPDDVWYVAEGAMTAISVAWASGCKTISAGAKDNLAIVVRDIRAHRPKARIIVAADNDEQGLRAAHEAAEAVGGSVTVPRLEDRRKPDFNDLLSETDLPWPEAKAEIRRQLREHEYKPHADILEGVMSGDAFLERETAPIVEVVSPLLRKPAHVLLSGQRGVGKTMLSMVLAHLACVGGGVLGCRADGGAKVLYIDGELPEAVLQQRLRQVRSALAISGNVPHLSVWPRWTAEDAARASSRKFNALNLADTTQHAALVEKCAAYDVVVFDNLSVLVRGKGERNSAEYWDPVNSFFSELRHRGVCAIAVAHKGKDPKSGTRGSSAQEDTCDTVIELDRIGDPEPGRNLVRLCVTKSRLTTDMPPIDFAFVGDGDQMSIEAISVQEGVQARWERQFRDAITDGTPLDVVAKRLKKKRPPTQKDSFYRAYRVVRGEIESRAQGDVIPFRRTKKVRVRRSNGVRD